MADSTITVNISEAMDKPFTVDASADGISNVSIPVCSTCIGTGKCNKYCTLKAAESLAFFVDKAEVVDSGVNDRKEMMYGRCYYTSGKIIEAAGTSSQKYSPVTELTALRPIFTRLESNSPSDLINLFFKGKSYPEDRVKELVQRANGLDNQSLVVIPFKNGMEIEGEFIDEGKGKKAKQKVIDEEQLIESLDFSSVEKLEEMLDEIKDIDNPENNSSTSDTTSESKQSKDNKAVKRVKMTGRISKMIITRNPSSSVIETELLIQVVNNGKYFKNLKLDEYGTNFYYPPSLFGLKNIKLAKDSIKIMGNGLIKPIEITDGYSSFYIDGHNIIYSDHKHNTVPVIVAEWRGNNPLDHLLSGKDADIYKTSLYKKVQAIIPYIERHRKFIIPVGLSEFNTVKVD